MIYERVTLRLKKQINELIMEQEKAKKGNEIISKVNKQRQKMLENYEGRERVEMKNVTASTCICLIIPFTDI